MLQNLDKRVIIAVAALLLVVVFWAGMQYAGMRDKSGLSEAQPGGIVLATTPEKDDSTKETGKAAEAVSIKVYVAGAVDRPDIYELGKGARVYEALLKAGPQVGADLASMGMARKLQDGETLYVCRTGETMPDTGLPLNPLESSKPDQKTSGLVDINNASSEELDKRLPGIGPALAGRIVDYRSNNGPFSDIEQLKDVSGIGNKKYEGIKDMVTVN